MIPDVLAHRYASRAMVDVWSPEVKIAEERRLWVRVLRAQARAGLEVSEEIVADYEAQVSNIDTASIMERERINHHDVKARIEEFNALAGHESIHLGLTSRDVTENVELQQLRQSLVLVRDKCVVVLDRLASLAVEHSTVALVGRSHNVPAQMTTLGKRFANVAQELLVAFHHLEWVLDRLPYRGLKGPVGTAQDLAEVFSGDYDTVVSVESDIATAMGFSDVLVSVGQVYPRSIDLQVLSSLLQIAAGPSNLATAIRLMAGNDLVSEGFDKAQVGSSAMPHKINPRSCERISGLQVLLRGFEVMAANLSGQQWNEGDVSCSVVRRVALPGACFAIDALLETFIAVLDGFAAFPFAIRAEVDAHAPFLSTTKVLVAAVQAGCGREEAHEIIREHSLRAVEERRRGGNPDLIGSLAADERLGISRDEIATTLGEPLSLSGFAHDQVRLVCEQIAEVSAKYPEAFDYQPEPVL